MDLFNLILMLNAGNKDSTYYPIFIILAYFIMNSVNFRSFKITFLINRLRDFIYYKTVFHFKIKLQYNSEVGRYYPNYSEESEAILWKYINSSSIQSNIKYALELPINMDIIKMYKSDDYFNHYKLGIQNKGIQINEDIYIFFDIDTTYTRDNKNNSDTHGNELIHISMFLKSVNRNLKYIQDCVNKVYIDFNEWKDNLSYTTKSIFFSGINPKGTTSTFYKYDFNSNKTFDNMFFEHKFNIKNRIDEYMNNYQHYKKLGIPHTLGFLFYGEPGCGKTSCIKAIANYMDRNIISINLAHIFDINDLRRLFLDKRTIRMNDDSYDIGYTIDNYKRLYVFEEIDCNSEDNILLDRNLKTESNNITDKNKNDLSNILMELNDNVSNKSSRASDNKVSRKRNIKLGEILELLDGISETDDRVIIFTTNYPEKLDKALIRPGRIDMMIEFKKLRRVDIRDNFKQWFGYDIPKDKLSKIKENSITQAEFGKLCFENKSNPNKIIDILIS